MNVGKIKKNKLLFWLIIIMVISLIVGCFFIAILSKDNQELVRTSINSYFAGIKDGNLQYMKGLYSVLTSNLLFILFMWIMGISVIGIFIGVLMLIYKSFIVGFSFACILYTYGYKGVIPAFIYILPEVLNLFFVFIIAYYSIRFSILLFGYLFRKKDYNRLVVIKRYLKLLVVVNCFVIINSLIIVFLIPNLLKLF